MRLEDISATKIRLSHGVVEYVFDLPDGGRTASQMRLELYMKDQKQVALSSVEVCSCSNDSVLPVPRDRRKTIQDLNTWLHSIVHAKRQHEIATQNQNMDVRPSSDNSWAESRGSTGSTPTKSNSNSNITDLHIIAALRCQTAITVRSGSLGSLLCLCECLLEADAMKINMEQFMDVKAPFCYWLVERLSSSSTAQMKAHRDRLVSVHKHYLSQEKKGLSSSLTAFDESCIKFGLNQIRKKLKTCCNIENGC